jgi:hypothetical protein
VSLTLGWFLGRAADLTNIKRGSFHDEAGLEFPINTEHPDQRAALLAAFAGLGSEAALQAILSKLIAGPATDAKVEAVRALLAGTLTVSAAALPLPAGAATQATLAQVVTALAGALKVNIPAAAQVQTIVTLTASQAAGTDPLIGANANRQAIQFGASADFKIAPTAGAADGLRVYASARDDLSGKLCPLGAIYLVPSSGLVTGNNVVVWEAS